MIFFWRRSDNGLDLRRFENYQIVELKDGMDGSDPKLAKMFKALGNPNRFQLFVEILQAGESSFEQGHHCFLHTIMERLEVGAPTVSHHLKELVNADLVDTDREGKFVTCRVNREAMVALAAFFNR